ncbi:MAG: MscL family protein [Candidatus Methanomethyliaceae archaeon]|nr:MscL family protein [Candidatus Methanomethyliaceae archaeon]
MDRDDEMLNELKNIRTLLTPKPAPPAPPPPKGMMNEFRAFISAYKVLGMAVAFILGLYLGALVGSLVKDLLMPLIGLVFPGLGNLSTLTFTVGDQIFGVGSFIAAVITFIIVALVIFLIVKMTKKWGIE